SLTVMLAFFVVKVTTSFLLLSIEGIKAVILSLLISQIISSVNFPGFSLASSLTDNKSTLSSTTGSGTSVTGLVTTDLSFWQALRLTAKNKYSKYFFIV